MVPHYAETTFLKNSLFLFLYAFNQPWKTVQLLKCLPEKITYIKRKHGKTNEFFPPKSLHLKFKLNFILDIPNILNRTYRLHSSFLGYPNPNGDKVYIYNFLKIKAYKNLDKKKIVKGFPCFFYIRVIFPENISRILGVFFL